MDELVSTHAVIHGLRDLADDYDAILCDVWGVVHDGERANLGACEALQRARARGKPVVLVTNAPRPASAVMQQIAAFGVEREAYDAVVSSGDVTVALMRQHGDAPFHYIGPPGDFTFLEEGWTGGGALPPRAGIENAAYVVCAGLVNDTTERAEDYDDSLRAMGARSLTMICANPDLVVYRGATLTPCAGALAARYEAQGGRAIYAGKPYAPIYEMAVRLAEEHVGAPLRRDRILAIGDAMRTDIAGAARFGIDAVFVTSGIHRAELHGEDGALDRDRYTQFLGGSNATPRAAIPDLIW